jgi:hypothetical protein
MAPGVNRGARFLTQGEDVSDSIDFRTRMLSREDAWRFQYRVRPYLGGASEEQLRDRLSDILRNFSALTGEGKLSLLPVDQGGLVWAQKLTDLQLEYHGRNQDVEAAARPEHIPFNLAALELVRANSGLVRHLSRKPVYCRFGELRWMKALHEQGELLLSPASFYRAAEHGVARQDDELLLPTMISPYDYDLGLVDPRLAERLPERCWIDLQHKKPCDHYLFCLTVAFDFRYFLDFGAGGAPAEACVLIHDQLKFDERLIAAVRRVLPGWHVSLGGVKYVDPYFIPQMLPNAGDEIFYFKNFRFMYQREYRLVALPPPGGGNKVLQRLPVALGSLGDISELVTLA